MSDGNALLMSGGVKWAAFPHPGTGVTGSVMTEPVQRQQRDFDDPNILLSWPNGDPKLEVVVNLQTNERDASVEDDDGMRALHIKGAMLPAIRDAVKRAGAAGLEIGGALRVVYTNDGENTKGKGSPPKVYAAEYRRPVGAGNGALMGNGHAAPPALSTPPPAPAQTYTQPAYVAPVAPTMAQPPDPWAGTPFAPQGTAPYTPPPNPTMDSLQRGQTPAAADAPAPAGVDPNLWARMDGSQRAAVLATLSAIVPF